MSDADRYSRQLRLAEVSASGQAALCASTCHVGSDPGAIVELSYLERAGVGHVRIDAGQKAAPFSHQASFRHTAARTHAAGAWRALQHIRRALELSR